MLLLEALFNELVEIVIQYYKEMWAIYILIYIEINEVARKQNKIIEIGLILFY